MKAILLISTIMAIWGLTMSCATIGPRGHEFQEYQVHRLKGDLPIDAKWDKPQWRGVEAIEIENPMGGKPKHRSWSFGTELGLQAGVSQVISRPKTGECKARMKTLGSEFKKGKHGDFLRRRKQPLLVALYRLRSRWQGNDLLFSATARET